MVPDKLIAAKILAYDIRPYFAIGYHALIFVEAEGIGTLAVDAKWRCYYDPITVEGWSVPHLATVLYHELCHLIRDHFIRAKRYGATLDRKIWNIATDAAINDGLLEEIAHLKVNVKNPAHRHEGFPGNPVTPSALKLPDNELEEFYYNKLMERKEAGDKALKQMMAEVPKIPGCGDCGSCADGVPAPYEPPTEARGTGDNPQATGLSTAEADLITQQIAHDVKDYAGRQAGKIAGGWDRWATEKLKPKVNYMRWLRSTLSNAVAEAEGKQDYTWMKPARRQGAMGSNFKMPGMTGYKPSVGTGIDTSGSMTGKQLAQCIAETSGLLRTLGYREKIVVASCDTVAHNVQTITRIDQIRLKGGGGTDMGVALATLTEYRPKLDIIILMTDCITPWPAERPKGAIVVVRIGEDGTLPPWPCHLVTIPDEE